MAFELNPVFILDLCNQQNRKFVKKCPFGSFQLWENIPFPKIFQLKKIPVSIMNELLCLLDFVSHVILNSLVNKLNP